MRVAVLKIAARVLPGRRSCARAVPLLSWDRRGRGVEHCLSARGTSLVVVTRWLGWRARSRFDGADRAILECVRRLEACMLRCPQCRSEYRDGFTHCADCFAELVVADPAGDEEQRVPAPDRLDLVSVFETGNPSLVFLAKTLLESADIEYVIRGEGLQDI